MKRFVRLALLVVGFVAFAHAIARAEAESASAPAPVEATLDNGLHVVLLPNRLAPIAVSIMLYGAGSADEPRPGIAHAVEHMLFRGTSSISAEQLASLASRMGADYNAATSEQNTFYYYKFPSAYTPIAIRIEADRMANARIAESDWTTERGAIEQEVRAAESNPGFGMAAKLRSTFFQSTPLEHAPLGTIAGFDAMHAADMRAFYDRWYHPNNATFVIAGDIDPQTVLAQIHAAFDRLPSATLPAHAPIAPPPLAQATIADTIDFPVGVGALAYRYPSAADPDYTASEVLGEVLRARRGAFAALGDSGRILGGFSVNESYREMGVLFFFVIPTQNDTAEHADALVLDLLAAYAKDGVPADLVDAAKAKLIADFDARNASISGLSFGYVDALGTGIPDPTHRAEAYRAVTTDDVNRVIHAYIATTNRLSMALTPKPSAAHAKSTAAASTGEHIGVSPTTYADVPAWARTAFAAPLRPPTPSTSGRIEKTLPNGLRYKVLHESIAPTVTIKGIVRTSPLLYVPKGKDGTHEALNAIIDYGTTTKSADEFQRRLAAISASADLGSTFSITVPAEHFEDAVALIADGVRNPLLPDDKLAIAKKNLTQSADAERFLPKAQAERAEAIAIYPKGDPHLRIITRETIAAITPKDVRAYYEAAFRPDVTTIAVVGDVAPERVDAALKAAFGSWANRGPTPSFRFPRIEATRSARGEGPAKTIVVKTKSVTQAQIELRQRFAMKRGDPDYVPLELANTILSGEGTGSLLMRELRTKRGYVYSADSTFTVDQTGANFSVSYATEARNERKASEAAIALLRGLQERPLPIDEVQRAKALLLAQRVLPLDSYAGLTSDLLRGANDGFDGDETWFWKALVATTPDQIRRAMHRIDIGRLVRVTLEPA